MLTLDEIQTQEKEAELTSFDKDAAWKLGNIAHDLAGENAKKLGFLLNYSTKKFFILLGQKRFMTRNSGLGEREML